MDWRRLIPIFGFALVTYMLVLQWSQFETDRRIVERSTDAPPSAQTITQPSPESSEAPTFLPEFEPIESAQSPGVQTDLTGLPADLTDVDHIVIETDVVRARISLQGGDLTEVALFEHTIEVNDPTPFRILQSQPARSFIAQSGLLDRNNRDITRQQPFRAQQSQFALETGDDVLRVPLQQTLSNGLEVTKTYVFRRGEYDIGVEFEVFNPTAEATQLSLFGQLRRDRSPDPSRGTGFAMASYLGVATTMEDDRYHKITFRNMERASHSHVNFGGWIGFLQHYFVSAWVPEQNQSHRYFAREANGLYYAGFTSPAQTLAAGASAVWQTQLFVGPKLQDRLAELAEHLQLTVDYGWLWWAAQPLFQLMTFIHSYVGNWGWTIVLLTIIIKIVFFPLSAKAYRSMAKMRKFAPKMQQMKELYGDDRQKMAQETMKLYKKEKINPMGGCLPMLVQMPVFIALYWVFMESVELRHSPFIFWIEDLSSRDPFFILPLIFGASMFLQMKLGAQPTDPMQQKVMKFLPIGFTAFFLLFPAGLVLYWVVNNSISITQQQFINWRVLREDERAAAKANADDA
jgi:YidC/Oxa1 family membrane protein insertase